MGNIELTGTGSLTMVNSSLSETGVITINGSSSFKTEGSTIDLLANTPSSGVQSSGLSVVSFNSTKVIFPVNASIQIEGSAFYAYNSTVSLNDSSQQYPARFQGNLTSFVSSQVSAQQVTNIYVGNSSSVKSITNVVSSSILDTGTNINQTIKMFGAYSISVLGTTIQDQGSGTETTDSFVFIGGGLITINQSQISSSAREYIGYVGNSTSNLAAIASNNLEISQSNLISGETSSYGIYQMSQLSLASNANITVLNSLIEAEGLQVSLSFEAISPPLVVHYVFLNQTRVETGQSPGSASFGAGYALVLDNTMIDIPYTSAAFSIYELWAVNSNITTPLTFSGGRIQAAYLYNFSATSMSVLTSAIFFQYDWAFVHTVTLGGGPAPNATITYVNSVTNVAQGTLQTNSTGWAEIPLLERQMASGVLTTAPLYVIEASTSNERSNQAVAFSNLTTYLTLSMLPLNDSSNNSQLNNFSYSLLFGLAYPETTVSLFTNSYPLNFNNNVSYSALDFSTVGSTGYTFSFTFAYPKNMSISTPTVKVDGVPLTSVKVTSNATFNFISFSVPSGQHEIAISYIPPIVTPPDQGPVFIEYAILIGVIAVIAGVLAFTLIMVRQRNRKLVSIDRKQSLSEESD